MKVILAGYNIDYETIMDLEDLCEDLEELTPETIAAAYARISRSPRAVYELRAAARGEVDKARQSNRNIVFEMGHSSIAEHAVFNIDVLGVSRLLVEDIEKFRLCSYTEKSQRYVLFKDDFVVPAEIKKAGLEVPFAEIIRRQNEYYHACYERLRPYVFAKHPDLAADPANRSLLEGWAKEDARYAIALATETQLGMTLNARNLELMLRRLAAHPLAEARDFSAALFKSTKSVAPSLVRYTEATDYDRLTRQELREMVSALKPSKLDPESRQSLKNMEFVPVFAGAISPSDEIPTVSLVHATPDADLRVLAGLIHSSSDRALTECFILAGQMDEEQRLEMMRTALRHIRSHDPVLREFEHVGLLFELTISASCFAQLKRHRMATLTVQDYNPALGVTVPPAIREIGMEESFMDIMTRTNEIYTQVGKANFAAAPYILTNAHRRRVAMKVNARELYHMARLRADRHAQWDIRELTEKMLAAARSVMPLTLLLATGKDGFDALYGQTYK
ncbi:MAG: FAD-dependent thymidylate synthase [Syntrophales bacterium]|jgi:flavin-dependent thymidylate synthase|nr:FAD-dependent thymidylate synthase [Syntrophales bacterium]